jgi:hypothetical protein
MLEALLDSGVSLLAWLNLWFEVGSKADAVRVMRGEVLAASRVLKSFPAFWVDVMTGAHSSLS